MAEASPALSLHHLTVLDATPAELVDIACRLGCSRVSVFTWVPPHAAGRFPCVHETDVAALRTRLADTGIAVCNLEVFPLAADIDPDDYRSALEIGARLGAARATVHVHASDTARATALFGAFCAMAAEYGLRVGLEFTSFAAVRTFAAAKRLVLDVQAANADIAFDPLHFQRNDGRVEALSADDAAQVRYAQLCDGPLRAPPDLYREAVTERAVPGDGAFPLAATMARLQPDVIDVEVPQHGSRDAGMTAFERARRAVVGARAVLASMACVAAPLDPFPNPIAAEITP